MLMLASNSKQSRASNFNSIEPGLLDTQCLREFQIICQTVFGYRFAHPYRPHGRISNSSFYLKLLLKVIHAFPYYYVAYSSLSLFTGIDNMYL